MKIIHYQDPGHGWIKVPNKLLTRLNIEDKISKYSYMRGDHSYLEDHSDAGIFLEACKERGIEIKIESKHTNNESRIRRYGQFCPGFIEPVKIGDILYQIKRDPEAMTDGFGPKIISVDAYVVSDIIGDSIGVEHTQSTQKYACKITHIPNCFHSGVYLDALKAQQRVGELLESLFSGRKGVRILWFNQDGTATLNFDYPIEGRSAFSVIYNPQSHSFKGSHLEHLEKFPFMEEVSPEDINLLFNIPILLKLELVNNQELSLLKNKVYADLDEFSNDIKGNL